MTIEIRKPGDSGNVAVSFIDSSRIVLDIESDNAAPFKQWFYFELCAKELTTVSLELIVEDTSFGGWHDAQPVIQTPGGTWQRHYAAFVNGRLKLKLTLLRGVTRIAYFEPYPYSSHKLFLASITTSESISVSTIGESLQGLPIDMIGIKLGKPPFKTIWVTARQHPGEVMGSWWIEGFIEKIERWKETPVGLKVFVVPMLNPDGVVHGNIRTNAAGVDLNRAWQSSPVHHAPEVTAVLSEMYKYPPDLYLDVHGVEDMRHCFLQPPEGTYGESTQATSKFAHFEAIVASHNRDLQRTTKFPYSGDGSIASNFITEEFQCLGLTVEMPFQDTSHNPQPGVGWTSERSGNLGADTFSSCVAFLAASA